MPTRVMGLASGMDIDTIVKDLMKAERVPLNKMQQEKTLLEWKRDDFREINTKILAFKNFMFDMTLTNKYRSKYITSTNETYVSAVARNNALIGSYTLEVEQLATASTLISGKLSVEGTLNLDQKVSDFLSGDFQWSHGKIHSEQLNVEDNTSTVDLSLPEGAQIVDGKMNVIVNGEIYEVVTSEEHLQDHQVYIDQSTGQLIFGKELKQGTKIQVQYVTDAPAEESEDYLSFSITNYTKDGRAQTFHFFIKPEETFSRVMTKINESPLGVTMFYDSFNSQFSLTLNETGNLNPHGAEISVSGEFLTDFLKFSEDNGATYIEGKNARFTINGLTTERTSNSFDMNGVTFTLKGITEQPVFLQVNHDTETIFENIKSFVEKYNEIVEAIEAKLREPRYRDYLPLTDEEREKLTDKQQEQWEEKARSGLLRNDPILSRFLTDLRMAVSGPVTHPDINSAIRSLADIGITTTSNYQSAKLEINESKLREAINNHPEAIEMLFRAEGSEENRNENGIARRLQAIAEAAENEIVRHAGRGTRQNHQFAIGRELIRIENDIEQFENRLKMIEDRYYSQFRRMELAIQRANTQAMMLLSVFNPFQSN